MGAVCACGKVCCTSCGCKGTEDGKEVIFCSRRCEKYPKNPDSQHKSRAEAAQDDAAHSGTPQVDQPQAEDEQD